jgi:methanogenesis imperfect marker protein 11
MVRPGPEERVVLTDPYIIRYPEIVAISDRDGRNVELVEFFECVGGAMWARLHYAKSPLVHSVRTVGGSTRYLLSPGGVNLDLEGSRFPAGICGVRVDGTEIAISYIGLGGGGVGASGCRSLAGGVVRTECDPSGGGKKAGATIWLPRRERVLIGVDDTDTPEEGATWTLCHNIARAVQDEDSRYLSHTIVQLFPVPYRTKNCVAVVCEFATGNPSRLVSSFQRLLERHTLSEKTGMAVFSGFDPSPLADYGWAVKRGEVNRERLAALKGPDLEYIMEGRGIIGAVAAIPFFTRYEEALQLCDGPR